MTRWYAGLVAVVAVGLAGCSTPAEESAGANVVTTSPVPERTTTTTTTTPAFPAAVDGTDVTACSDGVCEILVAGPVDIPTPEGVISVLTVAQGGVDLQMVSASGMTSTFSGQRPDQGGPSVLNDLAIEVVALRGGQAVLRFASA